jgi:putative ABC transport system permease protein
VDAADQPTLTIRPSSPGFLEATGTPLLSGRWFDERDRYGSEPVAVINRAAARLHYPDVDPIGRQLEASVSWGFAETPPLTIVGVIGDVRSRSATGDPDPALYLPNAQFGANSVYVWLRVRSGVTSVMQDARRVVTALDPELAITDVTTVAEVVEAEQHTPTFYLTLLTVFSALALVLASIGLYGVVAYSVSQRRREIGIRIALGAASGEVVRMVLGQGARPVAAGILLGLGMSWVGMRVLGSLLYGVEPFDPATVISVTVLLAAVTTAATFLPARRASRIPPSHALRAE